LTDDGRCTWKQGQIPLIFELRGAVTSSGHTLASPTLMPPPSKARKAALKREEARRLERAARTKSAAPQPTESTVVETQRVQPRGSSRSSKWRDKNQKTKKSRAVRIQPSVLKFFSVSNVDDRNTEGYGETDLNPLADGQPIGVHKATGTELSNAGQGSEGGGSSSTPEGSVELPQPDVLANPLAVRDPQVSEAGTNATPIQGLEHAVHNTDSVGDTVSSLGSV